MDETVNVRFDADLSGLDRALGDLSDLSAKFGSALTGALKGAILSGKSLEDVLRQVALRMADMALDIGLKPLQGLAGSFFSNFVGSFLPFAKGGVTPFASGGVVSRPTFFPAGGSLGLMGEAGSEAIMPLSRGPDGRLGVASSGQGGQSTSIVFNVSTPDATSFAKSEAQLSAMLARVVSRGSQRL
jgi:phage-related minor tail protein